MKNHIILYIFSLFLLGCGRNISESDESNNWPKAGDSFVTNQGSNPPYTNSRFKRYRNSYFRLWSNVKLRDNKISEVDSYVNKLVKYKSRYQAVSQSLGGKIPWAFIGIVHSLEGSVNFKKHLHNGDSLCAKTVRVPAGRPRHAPKSGRCYTWEESAKDAMILKGLQKWTGWNTIQVWGFALEGFNGFGYRNSRINIPSPYLWSYTHHYSKGKYCRDGVYCPSVVSKQAGAMSILKRLQQKGYNPFANSDSAPKNFADVSPHIGKRCYAMNPSFVEGKPYIVGRRKNHPKGAVAVKLNPGSIFTPVEVSQNGLWYNMSFKINGKTYGKGNPAWVYHNQVDCNDFVGKTCKTESAFGEAIALRTGPNTNLMGYYPPNMPIKVASVNNTKLWYYVTFTRNNKQVKGWMYRDQINCSGKNQAFLNKTMCVKTISGEPIKVRNEPGGDNDIKVIKTLDLSAKVKALMRVGNWYAVEFTLGGVKYGFTHSNPAYIYAGQTRSCQ